MPAFERYSVFPCRFGDIVLRDLGSIGFRSASKKSIVIPGGDLSPRAVVNVSSDPIIDMQTKDLAALFAGGSNVSISQGYAVNTLTSATSPTLLQFQKRADGASFVSSGSSAHQVATNPKGFLHVTELSAQQDDEEGAQASLDYVVMSGDGLTQPLTFSTTSLLSSALFGGIWYLGPVRVGNIGGSLSSLLGVQSVSIRPGIDFRAPRADGDVFPINGSIHAIVPEIRIVVLDLIAKAGFLSTPWGKALTAGGNTSVNIFFQKGVHGGGRVAAATAEHLVVVANTADETIDSITVNKLDDARSEIIIRPIGLLSLTANIAIT